MRKITASLLALMMVLGMCSCSVPGVPEESTTAATTSETTVATTESSASEETSASTSEEVSYVESGYLKGLKIIARENCFVSENEKFQDLINWTMKKAIETYFKGSLIIATDDEVLLFAGPNKSIDVDGNPVDPYTTYEIGSVTKMFTATIIMKMVEDGKIKLDDKLIKYFPEYKNGKDITIANLLSMSSGIPDMANEPDVFWGGKVTDNLNDTLLSDEDFLECLYALNPTFEPGTKCEYSNSNYHILGMIIEQIEGMSYGEVVKRDIFDPCGLEHSSAQTNGDVTSVPDPERGYHDFQNGARGAGDIHSCMADMVAFDRALFSGKIISMESLEAMKKDLTPTQYGYGLMLYDDFAYGHSGATVSYVSNNVVIDTEEFGKVYFVGSTSTALGIEGLTRSLEMAINWAK